MSLGLKYQGDQSEDKDQGERAPGWIKEAECQEGDRASAGLPCPGKGGTVACLSPQLEEVCVAVVFFPACVCVCVCVCVLCTSTGGLSHI